MDCTTILASRITLKANICIISDVFIILWNFVWNRLKDHAWHDGWPNSPQTTLLFHDFVIKFTQMKKGSGQKNAGSFLKVFPAIFSSCNTEGEFLVAPKNYQQLNEPLQGVFPGSAIFRNNSGTSVLKSKEMLWRYALIWCFVPCDLQFFQLSAHSRLPWQADSTGLCRQSRGFRKICKKIDKKCQDRCVFF